MKVLNPSLQFADEDGGALPPPNSKAIQDEVSQDLQTKDVIMSEDIDEQLQQSVVRIEPAQLKPGEFWNNDGSGSQIGRWTREEHMKFVKCKYRIGTIYETNRRNPPFTILVGIDVIFKILLSNIYLIN